MVIAEQWLDVVGWEALYAVSDAGRVRSLDRIIGGQRPGSTRRWRGRVLTPSVRSEGYLIVQLCRDGERVTRDVHTLVLEAFVGPRPDGHQGCHGNGIRSDCSLTNLRWDTPAGNAADAVAHGTHRNTAKVRCPRRHLLASPNLVAADAARGHRRCLACARARECERKALRAGRPFDFVAVADARYVVIMRGDAPAAAASPLVPA